MKRGDVIAYRKFGESSFHLKGKEYKFVSFDDVLCVFEKEVKNGTQTN